MRPNKQELEDFYKYSPAGAMARMMIGDIIEDMWGELEGRLIVGFGYAQPWLERFPKCTALALAPKAQGGSPWPQTGNNRSALVEEYLWPLASASVEGIILAHAIEHCERPAHLLMEVSRVLTPEGRIIVITPNRTGIWAHDEDTPFGHGQPYSARQIMHLLADCGLEIIDQRGALYGTPVKNSLLRRLSPAIERIGQFLDIQRIAGVTIIEARKRVIMLRGAPDRASRKLLSDVKGLANPAPDVAGM